MDPANLEEQLRRLREVDIPAPRQNLEQAVWRRIRLASAAPAEGQTSLWTPWPRWLTLPALLSSALLGALLSATLSQATVRPAAATAQALYFSVLTEHDPLSNLWER